MVQLLFCLLPLLTPPNAELQLALQVKENHIHLSWMAYPESGIHTFVLERQLDDGAFEALFRLPVVFVNPEGQNFSYDDHAILSDHAYRYRLRYLYKDGQEALSEEISTFFERSFIRVGDLYKDEANDQKIEILVEVFDACDIALSVFHDSGRALFTDTAQLPEGEHALALHFPELASGTYYIKIEAPDQISFKQFDIP